MGNFELINSNGDLVSYGTYASLKTFAIVEHLTNYIITPIC